MVAKICRFIVHVYCFEIETIQFKAMHPLHIQIVSWVQLFLIGLTNVAFYNEPCIQAVKYWCVMEIA